MIKSFQGLRCIAMFMIFLFHLTFLKDTLFYQTILYDGYCAVTFFLILSGFVTYYSNYDKVTNYDIKNSIKFTIKRVSKFYKLHFITFIFACIINMDTIFSNIVVHSIFAVLNILLLQAYFPIGYFSYNVVSWYLSALIICYLLSHFFICKINMLTIRRILLTIFIIYFSQCLIVTLGKDLSNTQWIFYINPFFRIFDFILGMLVAKVVIRRKNIKINSNFATILEVLVVLVFILLYLSAKNINQAYRWGVYYSPIMLMIIFIFSFEKGRLSCFLGNKYLLNLSSISLEFYMIHLLIIILLHKFLYDFPILIVILAFIITLVISYIIKYFKIKAQHQKCFLQPNLIISKED